MQLRDLQVGDLVWWVGKHDYAKPEQQRLRRITGVSRHQIVLSGVDKFYRASGFAYRGTRGKIRVTTLEELACQQSQQNVAFRN